MIYSWLMYKMASICKRDATMMKSSLIRINLIFILLILFIPNLTSAETKTFIKEYTYQASEADSKISSRTIALEQVKRLLLEELGTYLESRTEIRNFKLTKDEIVVLSAGVVRVNIKNEKWDGKEYYLIAEIVADPNEVIKSVDSLRRDRESVRDLTEAKRKADELIIEVSKLKKEIELAKGNLKNQKQNDYTNKVKFLSAIDWLQRGCSFIISKNYKDAIESLNNAIELNPQYYDAYIMRGITYMTLRDSGLGIKDFDKAIELYPKSSAAYSSRAVLYASLKNYPQALKDSNKAIELEPKNADEYLSRSLLYFLMGNFQLALKDIDYAIEQEPKSVFLGAYAYATRGCINVSLNKYEDAVKNFDKAIELNQTFGREFIEPEWGRGFKNLTVSSINDMAYEGRGRAHLGLMNYKLAIEDLNKVTKDGQFNDPQNYLYRGVAFFGLGNYQLAIKDFDKYIELAPTFAETYYWRAMAHAHLNNEQSMINDLKVAARLGHPKAQELLKIYSNIPQ